MSLIEVVLRSKNHHPNSKLIEVTHPIKINFREDLIKDVFREALLSFQNNISRQKGRLNTTDCYTFYVSFHLFPDMIIYGQKFRGSITQQKMFSKTKYKMLICYFKSNKTRLILESSCDPVKLQHGNDFKTIYKCESATVRMVGGGRPRSRLGSRGDPVDKQKLSSIL